MKFDGYHPTINLVYFVSVIGFTIWFQHPIFLAIGYLSAFAYSVKLNGIKALIFNLCLIPMMAAYAAFYAYYNHFGVTVLRQNFIDNAITLEALVYGTVISVTVATVFMMFSCLFTVFSTDKVVYLFGRVSPKLSLFLSILLRSVPRIKERGRKTNTAQCGIGRGVGQGNILKRFAGIFRIISIIITWTMENFVESAQSMKCRGYSLKGRTAFSIYRFDNRDRSFVVMIFLCLTLIFMAIAFNQTSIYYDPEIVMNRITFVSFFFYAAYAVLFLLPMVLQIAGERKFRRLRKR